jgi:phage tail-like protein
MRAAVAGMRPAHSLAGGLPEVVLTDERFAALVAAFDEVLAPVSAVVGDIDCYFDIALTPADFLPYLACWLGVTLRRDWDDEEQRSYLRSAVRIFGLRGTRQGLVDALRAGAGVDVTVEDNGGVEDSGIPNAPLPGTPEPFVVIRVDASRSGADVELIEEIVRQWKPVHVPHRIDFLSE